MIHNLTLRIARCHNTDPKKLQSISAKPFFKHYQTAITLSLQNKLQQANQHFVKSLQEIKLTKQKQLQHFPYILRRIAHNCRRLGKMKQAQQKLYEVIKHKRDCGISSVLLYDDYDRLYKHMLSYDLEKAIKLCKALMLKQKVDMPISHIKLFNFNLANAYLLSGNYMDAKNRYSKCLQADPQGNLKVYALNNLALACWWHKNPIQKVRETIQDEDPQRIQKDFSQAQGLFAKSILISQTMDLQTNQSKKMILEDVLDFKKGNLNQKLQFSSASSLFPIQNLAQFYLSNDPLKKIQILYWLKKALSLAKLGKKQKNFDSMYIKYLVLTNEIQTLQQKLPNLIQKHRYSQQFIEQANFCFILGKILNDPKDQKKIQKSQQYLNRAQQIKSILPHWSWKIKYIAIDELDLLHQ